METQVEMEQEDTGYIAELNHEGDTRYTWNRNNKAECEAAKEHFEALRLKGFLAFKVRRITGIKGEAVQEFNAEAGKYIYVAPPENEDEAPEMAKDFDPSANYVVTPQMAGG